MALTPGLAASPLRAMRTDPKTRRGAWRPFPFPVSRKAGCVHHNVESASRDQRRYVDDRRTLRGPWCFINAVSLVYLGSLHLRWRKQAQTCITQIEAQHKKDMVAVLLIIIE